MPAASKPSVAYSLASNISESPSSRTFRSARWGTVVDGTSDPDAVVELVVVLSTLPARTVDGFAVRSGADPPHAESPSRAATSPNRAINLDNGSPCCGDGDDWELNERKG